MKKLIAGLVLGLSLLSPFTSFAAVYVNGYTKSNGTYVQGYYRSDPNGTVTDNYSYIGNVNPYTGSVGTNYYTNSPSSEYYNSSYTPSYTSSYYPYIINDYDPNDPGVLEARQNYKDYCSGDKLTINSSKCADLAIAESVAMANARPAPAYVPPAVMNCNDGYFFSYVDQSCIKTKQSASVVSSDSDLQASLIKQISSLIAIVQQLQAQIAAILAARRQ
jgi:hypothetical protein